MSAFAASAVAGLEEGRPAVNKWLVAASVGFGALMGSIDSSIVNVALPQIRGAVGATVQEITWISTGYAIALVLVMPLTAFLGRLFGQKRVYLFCLGLFLLGSALCGTASSLTALVVYRVLQGLGGGALQPTQQAILRQTFPLKEQGMAMALFGIVIMLGPAIGPTVGGYIIDHWHWSWIFYINLPIGAVGLVMVSNFVHEDPAILAANHALAERQRKNVDWWGIGLMAVGLAALEYFLEEGNRDDWFESRLISAMFLIALISLSAFILRELTVETPAVDLRMFKNRVFLSGTLIGAFQFGILMTNMFLLPIFMQELLGYTALQSGITLVPRVLTMLVAMPIIGRIYGRVSPRLVVGIGVVLVAVGSCVMSKLTLDSGSWDIIAPSLIQAGGFACLFVPLTTVSLSLIPRHRLPDAAGLNSLVRQLGAAVGLAVSATLLSRWTTVARVAIDAHVTAVNPLAQQRLALIQAGLAGRGLNAAVAHRGAVAALYGIVSRQAFMLSLGRIFWATGIFFLVTLPLLAFLKTSANKSPLGAPVE